MRLFNYFYEDLMLEAKKPHKVRNPNQYVGTGPAGYRKDVGLTRYTGDEKKKVGKTLRDNTALEGRMKRQIKFSFMMMTAFKDEYEIIEEMFEKINARLRDINEYRGKANKHQIDVSRLEDSLVDLEKELKRAARIIYLLEQELEFKGHTKSEKAALKNKINEIDEKLQNKSLSKLEQDDLLELKFMYDRELRMAVPDEARKEELKNRLGGSSSIINTPIKDIATAKGFQKTHGFVIDSLTGKLKYRKGKLEEVERLKPGLLQKYKIKMANYSQNKKKLDAAKEYQDDNTEMALMIEQKLVENFSNYERVIRDLTDSAADNLKRAINQYESQENIKSFDDLKDIAVIDDEATLNFIQGVFDSRILNNVLTTFIDAKFGEGDDNDGGTHDYDDRELAPEEKKPEYEESSLYKQLNMLKNLTYLYKSALKTAKDKKYILNPRQFIDDILFKERQKKKYREYMDFLAIKNPTASNIIDKLKSNILEIPGLIARSKFSNEDKIALQQVVDEYENHQINQREAIFKIRDITVKYDNLEAVDEYKAGSKLSDEDWKTRFTRGLRPRREKVAKKQSKGKPITKIDMSKYNDVDPEDFGF